MLRLVKEFYIDNTIAAYAPLDYLHYSQEDRLIACANEIMEYSLKYPGILTMLKEAHKEKDSDTTSAKIVELTTEMNQKLDNVLSNILDPHSDSFEYKRMIFLSSILHPTSHFGITTFSPSIVYDKNERLKYVNYVIQTLKNH